jgi:DNA-binding transcriptional LysR family regulator
MKGASMTLQQLRYIITIVNCGSISEAAKQLYITQPSLSNAVKELELEYGVSIFNRTSKGITLSSDGSEFLSYARQILEQTDLMEQHYLNKKPLKRICSISTQHYAFAVNAFVNLVSRQENDEYEFTLREARTHEIIEDVKNFRSELGILYMNDFNENVLSKLFKESGIIFHPLFVASPHVFISSSHPLSYKEFVTMTDLEEFPFLAFEQGEKNSFYFSEEILSTVPRKKIIYVSDRATLFNLLIGLNGYTICSGILNSNLNGDNIIAIPLHTKEYMRIGWIANPRVHLSIFAENYLEELKNLISSDGLLLCSEE